jgi:light-regulated signal transduction histidine kinase (bacteriophytochrome)
MSDLIKDLLDHSRIGQKRQVTQSLDINEVVEQIKQDFHSKLSETNASIETENLPTIDCYDVEMRLLLQNLISNGMKFSKPHQPAVVKISCQTDSGAYHFKVEDNGIGIEPKYQDKIFVIFQRLHSKREYEGTGIGLAHCKKVLDLHKGKIWVESELGEGSTFHFTIPKVLN